MHYEKYYEKLNKINHPPGYLFTPMMSDYYLRTLGLILYDGAITPAQIKQYLLDETRATISGNLLRLLIQGQNASVGTCFDDDDDTQDRIIISKEKLIKFIDDWLEISKNKPSSIILWRDDQNTIWLEASNE